MWALDTQEVEGLNNTVRYVTKLAPHIQWHTMVARVLSRKLLVGYRGNLVLQAEQVANCVAHHHAAKLYVAEKGRFELSERELRGLPALDVPGGDCDDGDGDGAADGAGEGERGDAGRPEGGVDGEPAAPVWVPAAAATPDCVATLVAALKKIFAAKRGETLGPSFKYGFGMSWRNHTEPIATWQMLLPCDSYRKVLWVSEAWEVADDSDHMCLVTLPLKHRLLWMVLEAWHNRLLAARDGVVFNDSGGPDVNIDFVTLKWDRTRTHGIRAATIVDAEHLIAMIFACRRDMYY